MLLFENIGLALSAIKANTTRAILTMLGIIIGVAAVIGILSISDALDSSLSDMFADTIDSVSVGVSAIEDEEMGRGPRRFDMGPEMSDKDYINKDMIDDVLDKFSNKLKGVQLSIQESGSSSVSIEGNTANVVVSGMNEDALEKEEITLISGHMFYDIDYEEGHRVCLVNKDLVDDVYDGDNSKALGSQMSVRVDNNFQSYTIVGIYEVDSDSMYSGWDTEESTNVYIPLLLAMKETHSMYKFESVTFQAKSYQDCDQLAESIPRYLNKRYYKNNEHFETEGFSYSSMLEQISELLTKISIGLGCIAGISLLVGGIGVMNIMLVSITERTREIGTRKALGATNASIRTQFVVESIILCLVGGTIGVALGIGLGSIGCKLLESEYVFSLRSILIAFSFAAFVGVFFGYYPANKAAKMNPIDALRYE